MLRRTLSLVVVALLGSLAYAPCALAELVRWEVLSREDLGATSLERIIGIAHFEIDPADARNQVIADIGHAPVNKSARVEFSSDICIVRHKDAANSNGLALIEPPNRGGKPLIGTFGLGAAAKSDEDLGDRFVLDRGFDIVWIGWQFDVARTAGQLGISVPVAQGIEAMLRAELVPNTSAPTQNFSDLAGYSPADPTSDQCTLTVRDEQYGRSQPIERTRWQLAGNEVTLQGGFEPGRIYTLRYRANSLPIAGLGLAALRDGASWIKYAPDAPIHPTRTLAFGSSQCGRLLRSFLHGGFNQDEWGRPVFDAIWAHIAGAAYLSINERGATPTSLSAFVATSAPYSLDAMLAQQREPALRPKVFLTNTSCEYWCGGRSAALMHVTPDGLTDLTLSDKALSDKALSDNLRIYFLAGAQHGASSFPAQIGNGIQPDNPLESRWTMRALMSSMQSWLANDIAPPASRVPRIADGTLVSTASIGFPAIPGVQSPTGVQGVREGDQPIAFLVPAVDIDANERAGIRTPELTVALATYTGWNFRKASIGAPHALATLVGSRVAFARNALERERTHDPRPSIEERFPTEETYVSRARDAAAALVRDGFLLEADVPHVLARMQAQWSVR